MSDYLLIFNPKSGQGKAEVDAKIVQKVLEHEGHKSTLAPTKKPGDGTNFAKNATGYKVIVALGGDGTINEVASGLVQNQEQPFLGIIPSGTVNNLAQALNIPLDIKAAATVLSHLHTKKIDLGKLNDSYMVSTLTLGILADAALNVSQQEKQQLGAFAFIRHGIKSLLKHEYYPLILTFDDIPHSMDVQLILITMTNSVGGFTSFNPEANPADGLFHVICVTRLNFFASLKSVYCFIKRDFKNMPNAKYYQTDRLKIETTGNKPIYSRADGDPSEKLPLDMQVLWRKLKIVVPKT